MLHDAEAEKSVVIVFFDSEEDYARGDATLSAMPVDETPRPLSARVENDEPRIRSARPGP
jgi:hypothetical protein